MKQMTSLDIATSIVAGAVSAVFFVCIAALLATSCTAKSVTNETLRRAAACSDSLARTGGDSASLSEVCQAVLAR